MKNSHPRRYPARSPSRGRAKSCSLLVATTPLILRHCRVPESTRLADAPTRRRGKSRSLFVATPLSGFRMPCILAFLINLRTYSFARSFNGSTQDPFINQRVSDIISTTVAAAFIADGINIAFQKMSTLQLYPEGSFHGQEGSS